MHCFGKAGILPNEWLDLTFDQVDLFFEGRRLEAERINRAVNRLRGGAEGDVGIRYVVVLE